MKIISIWNPKGGQGKSLLAINLAAASLKLNLKPIVVCKDPQGTALLFHQGGNLDFEVTNSMPVTKEDADLVFVDHPAADWSSPTPDVFVIPTKPVRSDYAAFADALERAQKKHKPIIKVITDGHKQRKTEKNTSLTLQQQGAFEVTSSVVFTKAAEIYSSIFHPHLNKSYQIKERRAEIISILTAILGA